MPTDSGGPASVRPNDEEEPVMPGDDDKDKQVVQAKPPAGTGGNGQHAPAAETPDDAAKAFLQASVKWPDEKGDPNVSLAFLLGWRMWRAVEWSDTVDEQE